MATITFTHLSKAALNGPARDTSKGKAYKIVRFQNPGDKTPYGAVIPARMNGCVYIDDSGDEVSYGFGLAGTEFILEL